MYVDVAVDFSDKDRLRRYTYSVPPNLTVVPGDLLWVPFGYRPIQAIALSISDSTETENVRPIDSVVPDGPFISEHLLRVAEWIADYYRTNIFRACVAMLPPGANRQLHIWVSKNPDAQEPIGLLSESTESVERGRVLAELSPNRRVRRDRLVRKIGRSKERYLNALVRDGVVIEESIWERPRTKAVFNSYVALVDNGLGVDEVASDYRKRRAHRRLDLIHHLAAANEPIPRAELSRIFSPNIVKAVIDDGNAKIERVRVERDPLADYSVQDTIAHELTPEQRSAVESTSQGIERDSEDGSYRPFLLFGVTGSGKTEVYLRAVERCIKVGRRAIVMVPEIAMTPQTLQRFASRFPGQIALQHSGLTLGQRFDQWHRIKNGDYKVVIGSRSSIFAPVDDLGLVVIDEEHEWTFKQSDRAPRYHARDVAERLCRATGATLILGSATPDLVSYHRSSADIKVGGISRLTLSRRINQATRSAYAANAGNDRGEGYAESKIVDMKLELQDGHREMLSRPLLSALRDNVQNGGKSILFINRRGSASFVQCMSCGTIRSCPNCQTPLTLHRNPRRGASNRFQCHYCSYSVGAERRCRDCGGNGIARRAAGTEGVEEVVRGFFPNTPILRWDSDTARNAAEHTKLLDEFQSKGNHILIGTQMVAKGLDIPSVSLVGVVAADIGLAVPRFRSAERTFQLLSQVTGRAGRADTPGLAIIQTFQPEHYAIAAAAHQDYEGFYELEIAARRKYLLPPFARYVRLLCSAYDDDDSQMEARSVRYRIDQYLETAAGITVEVAGPSPAYPARLAGRYRWQILLKGEDPSQVLDAVALGPGWAVDVDPIEMS